MNALVVPTNSASRLAEFLTAWAPWPWDRIYVVQDEPRAAIEIPPELEADAAERLEVHAWPDIDAALSNPEIISREDSAIRSYGFWLAWRAGAEIIFTLDDDCHPSADDLVAGHRDNLYRTPVWQSSVDGLHVRGLPYRDAGVLHDVHLSVGLWRGTPDLDAVATLAATGPAPSIGNPRTRVVSPDQLFPMSGMNLAFRREIACLMYFAPMGRGRPYRRFDDIWCGLVVQRIARHLRYPIVCGHPFVDHRRASDPFVNLAKEAPGLGVNEHLWRTVAAVRLTGETPHACMREMGVALAGEEDPYVASWGDSIGRWCELFDTADLPART